MLISKFISLLQKKIIIFGSVNYAQTTSTSLSKTFELESVNFNFLLVLLIYLTFKHSYLVLSHYKKMRKNIQPLLRIWHFVNVWLEHAQAFWRLPQVIYISVSFYEMNFLPFYVFFFYSILKD